MTARDPASPFQDIRRRGFVRRSPLTDGWSWIDERVAAPAARVLPLADCAGLRLADAVAAVGDWPPDDRAALDGYAVAATDTLGAGSYNPVPLIAPLTMAVAVSAGDALPPGCDAVIPYEAAQAVGPVVEAIHVVAPGSGVERRGAWIAAGSPLLPAGRRLRPADLGLLAAAGHDGVPVLPAPRVRILLAGGPKAGAPEQLGAMLAALVRRDGGVVETIETLPAGIDALAEAFVRPGADLILSAGRTGTGSDDVAPPALARAGRLDLHGIAMRPGGSAGAGIAGGTPVLLLPGEPMAALAAYELLAGRAVRLAAGLPADPPHAAVQAVTARKLVSEIGCLDLHRVRLDEDGRVEPVASPGWPGLAAAARADGFVLIGADSEGVPDGVPVIMYRFD